MGVCDLQGLRFTATPGVCVCVNVAYVPLRFFQTDRNKSIKTNCRSILRLVDLSYKFDLLCLLGIPANQTMRIYAKIYDVNNNNQCVCSLHLFCTHVLSQCGEIAQFVRAQGR